MNEEKQDCSVNDTSQKAQEPETQKEPDTAKTEEAKSSQEKPQETKKEEKKLLKKLEKECKSLCSRITQYLWDDTCAMCGKAGSNAHHFFGWKACSAVRFVLDNLVWLCYACRKLLTNDYK